MLFELIVISINGIYSQHNWNSLKSQREKKPFDFNLK